MVQLYGKHIPKSFFDLPKEKFLKFVLTPDFLFGKSNEEKEKIIGDCWESVNGTQNDNNGTNIPANKKKKAK